jgi:hypothetical protein
LPKITARGVAPRPPDFHDDRLNAIIVPAKNIRPRFAEAAISPRFLSIILATALPDADGRTRLA